MKMFARETKSCRCHCIRIILDDKAKYASIFDTTLLEFVSSEHSCLALMYLFNFFIDFLCFLYSAAKR